MAWSNNLIPSISNEIWRLSGDSIYIIDDSHTLIHHSKKMGYATTQTDSGLNIETNKLHIRFNYAALDGGDKNLLPHADPTVSEIWGIVKIIPAEVTDPDEPYYGEQLYQQCITLPLAQSWKDGRIVQSAATTNNYVYSQVEVPIDYRIKLIDKFILHMWFDVPCELYSAQLRYDK